MKSAGNPMWRIYVWSLLFSNSYALHFFLDEGKEKCFLQELAKETLVVAHYRCTVTGTLQVKDSDLNARHGIMVEIKDPAKRIVLSRAYQHEGRFSYHSHEPGVYSICLRSKTADLSKHKLRIDFDLQVGDHAVNHSAKIDAKHLSDIEGKYQQLVEKATEINKELDYLRYREEMFRGTTESISRRVLLWMVVETVLLILVGVWQMENLRRFFESKKLV